MNNKSSPCLDMEAITTYFMRQTDVVAAYLFGSMARDQAHPLSDVDIAVLLEPGLDLEDSVERQIQLMVALDDFADRDVQITILNRAPPTLAYQVIRDGSLLHERDRLERVAFEVRIMKSYFDLKPMLDFHRQTLLKHIREVGLGRREGRHPRTLEAAQRIRERLVGATER